MLTADCCRLLVAMINDPTRDDRSDRRAPRPTVKRRVAALRLRARGVKSPFQVGVEDGHVAPRAGAERAAIRELENTGGVDGAEFDQAFEADDAFADEPVE